MDGHGRGEAVDSSSSFGANASTPVPTENDSSKHNDVPLVSQDNAVAAVNANTATVGSKRPHSPDNDHDEDRITSDHHTKLTLPSQNGEDEATESSQPIATIQPAAKKPRHSQDDDSHLRQSRRVKERREQHQDATNDLPPPHHHHHFHHGNVPVKEIHMTRKEKEEEERIRKLDSDTLVYLREALVRPDNPALNVHLNDDEIMHFLMKVDRDAQHLAHLQGGSHPEESDGSLLDELVAQSEDLALGREVFHKAVSAVHRKHLGSTDRKTIEWVRKASGLGKHKIDHFFRENADALHARSGNGTRFTRNMAKSTREERREKGLGLLLEAVNELEDQLGPYPPFKPKKRKREKTEKVAASSVAASSVDATEVPRKSKSKKTDRETKRKTSATTADRKSTKTTRVNGQKSSTRSETSDRGNAATTGSKTIRLKFTPPTWDDVARYEDYAVYDYPVCRSTEPAVYARKTMRLWKCMNNKVLSWARYEFFYSDVDRAWYVNYFDMIFGYIGCRLL
jgi:hypothetical protein